MTSNDMIDLWSMLHVLPYNIY